MPSLIVLVLVGGGWWLGQALAGANSSPFTRVSVRMRAWAERSQSPVGARLRSRLGGQIVELPVLLLLGGLSVVGLWAFIELLEDVIMGDGVVGLDSAVHRWLELRRTPGLDRLLVGITELGDAKVALPVAAVAIALFAGLKRWREALFLAVAIAGAAGFVAGLKRVIHRARPVDIYDGVAEYSFPSGHAAMSIVLFGFLAFLLAVRAEPALRRTLYSGSIVLVLLIGFSRVYLGAHWLSDVLAGLAFGLVWNSVLAIAYLQPFAGNGPPPTMPTALVYCVAAALVLSGAWHMQRDYHAEFQRYAPIVDNSEAISPSRGRPGQALIRP
jgi:membrane-associated phospholipid phosphatase